MVRKTIHIDERHQEWIESNGINLSKFIRNYLERCYMEQIYPKHEERNHIVYKEIAENPDITDGFKRNLGIEDFKGISNC